MQEIWVSFITSAECFPVLAELRRIMDLTRQVGAEARTRWGSSIINIRIISGLEESTKQVRSGY
jgi:hypothetical protein